MLGCSLPPTPASHTPEAQVWQGKCGGRGRSWGQTLIALGVVDQGNTNSQIKTPRLRALESEAPATSSGEEGSETQEAEPRMSA